jgi:hypothetical protein
VGDLIKALASTLAPHTGAHTAGLRVRVGVGVRVG